ncbi:hypothetical protein [Azospirillum sp. SYSU D00513]|uniref:DUF6898 family protein n=1 Tax=Azospirillum sp. SYSU D00513 TaxID=2812561 RepID=UPI001A973F64|nr:hypothetical protein [Azospirillum sp. SYSU D00513]
MADGDGEVLIEYQRIGNYMKAIAIDPKTGREVSVAGPATGSRELLTRTAVNKLRFVLKREAEQKKAGR